MSFRGKRELLVQVAPRYGSARHGQRSVILDEFVAPIRRPRAAYDGPDVQAALCGLVGRQQDLRQAAGAILT